MTPSERTAFLKTTDLLKGASEDLLSQISDGMTEVVETAGTPLFHAGDAGDAVYLIVEGALKIERDGIQLATRGQSECIGEFALIDDAPRSTDALAESDVRLLRWNRTDFQAALSRRPEVAEGVFKILLGKLREDVDTQVSAGLERERWQQDLKRAHEIQMGMLPKEDLRTQLLEISGLWSPATDIAGDYFDYLTLSENQIGVIIGDVTGHGFYSGLFVAMAKTCLHLQINLDNRPTQIIDAMNRTVLMSMQSSMLIPAVTQ